MQWLWKGVQKNLAVILALALVLSSFGGAPALVWAHADGSACATCPAVELAQQAADTCCEPKVPTITAPDCQVCCEAEKHHEPSQHIQLVVYLALLPEWRAISQPVAAAVGMFPTGQHRSLRAAFQSPPSLRGPPLRVRFT